MKLWRFPINLTNRIEILLGSKISHTKNVFHAYSKNLNVKCEDASLVHIYTKRVVVVFFATLKTTTEQVITSTVLMC